MQDAQETCTRGQAETGAACQLNEPQQQDPGWQHVVPCAAICPYPVGPRSPIRLPGHFRVLWPPQCSDGKAGAETEQHKGSGKAERGLAPSPSQARL